MLAGKILGLLSSAYAIGLAGPFHWRRRGHAAVVSCVSAASQ